MNAHAPADVNPPARKWRYWTWPLIVVGLLLGHLSIMVTAVVLATGDKSFAVLPNYYDKAVNWDKNQAELRASEELGWQVTVIPSADVGPTGHRGLTVSVADAAGQPVADAVVDLTWYHHKRPNELLKAAFHTDRAGRAAETVVMRGEGFYQVNVTATAGGRRFVTVLTPFVSNAKRGPS
jgi:nitrogen fixation protein FixH